MTHVKVRSSNPPQNTSGVVFVFNRIAMRWVGLLVVIVSNTFEFVRVFFYIATSYIQSDQCMHMFATDKCMFAWSSVKAYLFFSFVLLVKLFGLFDSVDFKPSEQLVVISTLRVFRLVIVVRSSLDSRDWNCFRRESVTHSHNKLIQKDNRSRWNGTKCTT